ncbi:MAG TPA: LacI family DNA-binding transcriptional regulator [Thermomicrobiales bacterium]|nr:LacI family DNA-binding transcriptional regulator [Thermomicrobiales bacterium]
MQQGSRPTITDVARIAGVSKTTVSYVLSGPEERAARISEETANRVLSAAREVGYVPNESARSLRMRRTNRVLFLGGRLNSLYSQAMAQSIERALVTHGLSLGVQIGSSTEHIERAVAALGQHLADGLIVESNDLHLPELRRAATRGHAVVAIGPSRPEPAFDVMSFDIAPAVREAMSHLVDRRYRHFVLLYPFAKPEDDFRIHVAHQRLQELGIPENAITLIHCAHDRIAAHECALRFLPGMPHPVAVYAGSDVSAIGVLWASIRLGRNVPTDVGIVGHGNTPEISITVPGITSLGPVTTDFTRAADLMASRLRKPSLPGRFITEPYLLTIRESTQQSLAP